MATAKFGAITRLLEPSGDIDRGRLIAKVQTLQVSALAAAIGLFVLFGSYWGINVFAYNYVANDQWCDLATEGIGVHCFSDFHQFVLIPPGEMLGDLVNTSQGRSPISGLMSDAFSIIGGVSPRGALVGWILLSAVLMALPMVWATRRLGATQRIQAVLILGVLTLPFWATLDRGQQMALAVPLFFIYGMALVKERHTWVAVASAGLFLVKPYLILLVIPILFSRKVRPMLVWLGVVTAGLLVSFIPYGSNAISRAQSWASQLLGVGDVQGFRFDTSPTSEAITVAFPYDYSLSGVLTDITYRLSALIDVTWLLELIPGLTFVSVLLSALAVVLLTLVRRQLSPVRYTVALVATASLAVTPAYSYQFAFALAGMALLVSLGSSQHHPTREASASDRLVEPFLVLLLVLSLTPLIVPMNLPDASQVLGSSEYPQIDNIYPVILMILWYAFIVLTIFQGSMGRFRSGSRSESRYAHGAGRALFVASLALIAIGTPLVVGTGNAPVRSMNLMGFEKVPESFGSTGSGYGSSMELVTDLHAVGGAERTIYFPADAYGSSPQCLGGQIRLAVESIDIRLNDAAGQEKVVESFSPVGGVEHRLVLTPDGRSIVLESEAIQSVTFDEPICLNVGGAELAAAPTESLFVQVGTPNKALVGVRALGVLLIIGGLGAMAAVWFTRRRQRAISLSI